MKKDRKILIGIGIVLVLLALLYNSGGFSVITEGLSSTPSCFVVKPCADDSSCTTICSQYSSCTTLTFDTKLVACINDETYSLEENVVAEDSSSTKVTGQSRGGFR